MVLYIVKLNALVSNVFTKRLMTYHRDFHPQDTERTCREDNLWTV